MQPCSCSCTVHPALATLYNVLLPLSSPKRNSSLKLLSLKIEYPTRSWLYNYLLVRNKCLNFWLLLLAHFWSFQLFQLPELHKQKFSTFSFSAFLSYNPSVLNGFGRVTQSRSSELALTLTALILGLAFQQGSTNEEQATSPRDEPEPEPETTSRYSKHKVARPWQITYMSINLRKKIL